MIIFNHYFPWVRILIANLNKYLFRSPYTKAEVFASALFFCFGFIKFRKYD